MNNYVISCCSPVDYAKEDLAALDVETIYFHIILDGKDYLDDFGQTLSAEALLDAQRAGRDVKTSQISVGEYKDFFRPFLEAGRDILHITVSSGLSGTFTTLPAWQLITSWRNFRSARSLWWIPSAAPVVTG